MESCWQVAQECGQIYCNQRCDQDGRSLRFLGGSLIDFMLNIESVFDTMHKYAGFLASDESGASGSGAGDENDPPEGSSPSESHPPMGSLSRCPFGQPRRRSSAARTSSLSALLHRQASLSKTPSPGADPSHSFDSLTPPNLIRVSIKHPQDGDKGGGGGGSSGGRSSSGSLSADVDPFDPLELDSIAAQPNDIIVLNYRSLHQTSMEANEFVGHLLIGVIRRLASTLYGLSVDIGYVNLMNTSSSSRGPHPALQRTCSESRHTPPAPCHPDDDMFTESYSY